ncbi:pimeloyl-ACP methyl ester carboxylesterase [Catenuloplanes nepalensis]|uniref:Pimeloyl-ACP methyl ester carboxylesterase n=1 Tax=Catenuloplanes nepalensis TaxID=587533 RepID=A0ABT9MUV3_9ACTN|nr:epoxide hydrolase family protein [Catenuloplanes nepalensis]MDP9795232.1 pimeloyl-ACP methyl ester carboxylesterase [Catenuloplanes nepalensis]
MLKPFTLHVSDDDLADLRRRLRDTRAPAPIHAPGWTAGADAETMARLVRYWSGDFDWRARESEINALPQFTADVGGTRVHLVHLRGEGPNPLPIVLTHGWPSTFLELTRLGDRLAHPSRYGGDPADACDVVIPSLPGFTFSAPSRVPAHELWHTLMHDVLGYRRYAAHGGDLGAGVSSRLAAFHPSSVLGLHLLAVMTPPGEPVTDEERAHVARVARWHAEEGGYEHLQRTRPLTAAHGLSDSPAGLLAWIAEKYRAWSDRPDAFTDDELLTQVSLYWFTNTIATSFLPYFDHRPFWQRIEVPTGLAVFPADLARPPRSWAERTYHLTRYTAMPRGGHFAAHEEPALLTADITEFLRPLR